MYEVLPGYCKYRILEDYEEATLPIKSWNGCFNRFVMDYFEYKEIAGNTAPSNIITTLKILIVKK